jgi:8-oxo-dGTP pyrophosphatase MutT (NUDIX family)
MAGSDGASRGFSTSSLETVHDWTYSKLVTRRVVGPRGDAFSRTYVDSPGAVAVVAVTADDCIVLVDQYRATVDGFVTEIPAGMRDVEGEEPLLTAQRELMEEAGYSALRWEPLGSILSTPGVCNSSVEIFLAMDLVEGTVAPHGPEEDAMTVLKVPFDEAVRLALHGEITDSKSVAGILRAARILGR